MARPLLCILLLDDYSDCAAFSTIHIAPINVIHCEGLIIQQGCSLDHGLPQWNFKLKHFCFACNCKYTPHYGYQCCICCCFIVFYFWKQLITQRKTILTYIIQKYQYHEPNPPPRYIFHSSGNPPFYALLVTLLHPCLKFTQLKGIPHKAILTQSPLNSHTIISTCSILLI
jgi:hypothetical protein